jgi:SecD/SecF fusion protein
VAAENRAQVTRYISSIENQRYIPRDIQFLWSAKSEQMGEDLKEYWRLYVIKSRAELTGDKLADARSTMGSGYDPQSAGKPIVQLEFTREGGRVFSRVTGANVGSRLAIVLDDKVYMAPNLQEKISGGSASRYRFRNSGRSSRHRDRASRRRASCFGDMWPKRANGRAVARA